MKSTPILLCMPILMAPLLVFAGDLGMDLLLRKPSAQQKSQVIRGDQATIAVWEVVGVQNTAPIKGGNGSFGYNDPCTVQPGAQVEAVGLDGYSILVRYSINGTQYGSSCPSGALFFTTVDKFTQMTAEYDKIYINKNI